MNNCADLELKGIIRRDSQNIPKVKTCLSLFKVLVFYARRWQFPSLPWFNVEAVVPLFRLDIRYEILRNFLTLYTTKTAE